MSYVSLRQFMQARGLDSSQGIRALEPGIGSFSLWAVILGDLSGVWNRDDGGKYYISHSQNSIWWAGLSSDGQFYDGLGYSNVFTGTIAGNRISGRWVDVPRGSTKNAGSLQLIVNTDPAGNVTELSMPTSGSPFWAFEAHSRPDAPDILDVFNRVLKNQHGFWGSYESLLDNLLPFKVHPVVVFGKIPDSRPIVNIRQADVDGNHEYINQEYKDFICWDDPDKDGDLQFEIEVDRALLQGGFWTTDWQTTNWPGAPEDFRLWLNDADGKLHCETIMYGKTAGCGDHSHYDDPPLLPGWQESAGNSVLINGLPIEGSIKIESDKDFHVNKINQIDTYDIQKWVQVRVTGILVLDRGHTFGSRWPEIHPVLAIDIVNRTPQENLTGVWADQANGLTVYIRHVDSEIWWLAISPTLDYRVAQVFQGTILPDGKTIQGMISDVPLGTTFQANGPRSLTCLVDPGRLFLLNTADQSVFLNKLYDAD